MSWFMQQLFRFMQQLFRGVRAVKRAYEDAGRAVRRAECGHGAVMFTGHLNKHTPMIPPTTQPSDFTAERLAYARRHGIGVLCIICGAQLAREEKAA